MFLAQGPQRSDAGEARTHGPSVLSQALYHWATALPFSLIIMHLWINFKYSHAYLISKDYEMHHTFMNAHIQNPKFMVMAETSTFGIFCGRNVRGRNVQAETS